LHELLLLPAALVNESLIGLYREQHVEHVYSLLDVPATI
jgi:hypothetical protein